MLAIHQNGTRMTSRKRRRPRRVRAFNGSTASEWGGAAALLPHTLPPHHSFRSRSASSVLVAPLPGRGLLSVRLLAVAEQVAADQDDAEDQDRDHEEADRDPAAPPELAEGDLIGV